MMETPRSVAIPEAALAHLRSADPVLRALIDRIGPIEYPVDAYLWRAVIGSIVGQQLSVKAAATIRSRVGAIGGNGFPTPETILRVSAEELRACGLSRAKVSYVQGAARSWSAGEIDPDDLRTAPDDAVIATLAGLRGVGRWTAEMVLIFSLGRPDVLAVDDLGIRTAVQRVYGLADRPNRVEVMRIGEPWQPFRSFASLYLWWSLR
jgi:DNA-3-methyladenine glycosylase II